MTRSIACCGRRETHGMTGTRTYNTWRNMRRRCDSPDNPRWDRYGGRGIKVCPEWSSFKRFLADMGEVPEGYTIERIDVDGDYTKDNCCWLPAEDQQANTTRTKRYEGKTVRQWAEELDVPIETMRARFKRLGRPFVDQVQKPKFSRRKC